MARVAVITGATSGIGLRTAEIFVAEGAKNRGRRPPPWWEGEALAKKLGPACLFRRTDVTVEEEMRALIGGGGRENSAASIVCSTMRAGQRKTGGIEGLDVARFRRRDGGTGAQWSCSA